MYDGIIEWNGGLPDIFSLYGLGTHATFEFDQNRAITSWHIDFDWDRQIGWVSDGGDYFSIFRDPYPEYDAAPGTWELTSVIPDAVVPLPASGMLLAAGIAAFAMVRRERPRPCPDNLKR